MRALKVYLGKSNAAKLNIVIAAKFFLKDNLGCEIVEWKSNVSQETNERNLLSCDLMYIIPDPHAGVLGKGLYETIRKFKQQRPDSLVVIERNDTIELVGDVSMFTYCRDWSRYASYTIGQEWRSKTDFFQTKLNLGFAKETDPNYVHYDIVALAPPTRAKNNGKWEDDPYVMLLIELL